MVVNNCSVRKRKQKIITHKYIVVEKKISTYRKILCNIVYHVLLYLRYIRTSEHPVSIYLYYVRRENSDIFCHYIVIYRIVYTIFIWGTHIRSNIKNYHLNKILLIHCSDEIIKVFDIDIYKKIIKVYVDII